MTTTNSTPEDKSILVVEDDETTQSLLRIWLSRAGYECTILSNAHQVLAHLAGCAYPDLILMDIRIPGGVNGIDLTRQIKNHTATRAIPIVILTVDGYEKKKAMEAGASGYLLKPISKLTLLSEVRKNLRFNLVENS
jgi:CheY-like chemotaxis protein